MIHIRLLAAGRQAVHQRNPILLPSLLYRRASADRTPAAHAVGLYL
jgi:hypothetical protein